MICPTGKAKYFCKQGWTGKSLICPSGKSNSPSGKRSSGATSSRQATFCHFPPVPQSTRLGVHCGRNDKEGSRAEGKKRFERTGRPPHRGYPQRRRGYASAYMGGPVG